MFISTVLNGLSRCLNAIDTRKHICLISTESMKILSL